MKLHYNGPVVLAILDGVGLRTDLSGNAVKQAHTDFINYAISNYPCLSLAASGTAVGVLDGDMGNSEVGHNTMGAGQIIKQGAARINESFATGSIWESQSWQDAIKRVTYHDSTLHFAGILSDGNVHSSIEHLKTMVKEAHSQGVKHIRVHAVLDGRDTPPQSATKYIAELESLFKSFTDHPDYKIASGGGRMVYVADRYENDWNVVKAGWDAIVHGVAPHKFSSATEAVEYFRSRDPHIQDQYIPPFVITEYDQPVGTVQDHDAFIYFDFRADRAIEFAIAMTYNDFPHFDRGYRPDVYFVGLTEYNSDTHVPEHILIPPVNIPDPLNTFLGQHKLKQLAVSETVKFGHVTYYFNGNSYEKAPGEEHIEIPSDTQPFDTRPWMKSAEITDATIKRLNKYQFIRLNYPGGDMVGHFAELEPTIIAIEAIDLQLARLAKEVDRTGGILLITADHGNAEELTDDIGRPKTSHSTNPVPLIFYDNTKNRQHYRLRRLENAGLANLASTIALLLGENHYPDSWSDPLIETID